MRDRIWRVWGVGAGALAIGLAAGWWLRGDGSKARQATSGAAPIVRLSHPELQPANQTRPQRVDGEPSSEQRTPGPIVLPEASVKLVEPGVPAPAPRPTPARAPLDRVIEEWGTELPLDAELPRDVAEMDDEERARVRIEDFAEFGDGPVAREPVPEPNQSPEENKPEVHCLPLGAPGCQRDVDCCGAGVCRTRAGEIAGFRQCRESP